MKAKLLLLVFVLFANAGFAQNAKKEIKGSNAYGADVKDEANVNLTKYSNQLIQESDTEFAKRTKWFTDAKFGLFIHFGLYSQLEGDYKGKTSNKYASWIQADLNIPKMEYEGLLQTWNPKHFNAKKIVKAAKSANMKYLVITSKHHEGFCIWPSEFTDFDIDSTPMKGRDLLKELSDECKKEGIKFGTYYSIIDWNHPSQNVNPEVKTKWMKWGNIEMDETQKVAYITYLKNQVKELIVNYDSEIMWFDADWVYWWNMEVGIDLYNYIREIKPSIIINNRCAKRAKFKKDFGTPEQEHHADTKNYLWEACYTMNNSWAFKKGDNNWKTSETIYKQLNDINENGGNFLLNIGPDRNGNIPKQSVTILKEVGMLLDEDK